MWVKLGDDYLNLEHVARVRFSHAWKNAQEQASAEVEVVVDGVLQGCTRYRGSEAQLLRAARQQQAVTGEGLPEGLAPRAPAATRETLAEFVVSAVQ